VLGSEGDGLSPIVLEACDEAVAIRMPPTVDSLNVGKCARRFFMYEVNRQTGEDVGRRAALRAAAGGLQELHRIFGGAEEKSDPLRARSGRAPAIVLTSCRHFRNRQTLWCYA
jgi:tRNA C32,U32 (ribose-2'-O)-methylase TrmJ